MFPGLSLLDSPQAASRERSARFPDWLYFTSTREGIAVCDRVAEAMIARGYCEVEVFGVRLALEEALVNAVKHGNQNDPTKCVWASWIVDPRRVLVAIEDEGDGFDPRAVPDPCTLENLERSCGRGLLLMRTYMSWVRYNSRGNRVTMIKRRGCA
jgi:serine/threonine-protein kinase RsbW